MRTSENFCSTHFVNKGKNKGRSCSTHRPSSCNGASAAAVGDGGRYAERRLGVHVYSLVLPLSSLAVPGVCLNSM
jgi:hypothetical protein